MEARREGERDSRGRRSVNLWFFMQDSTVLFENRLSRLETGSVVGYILFVHIAVSILNADARVGIFAYIKPMNLPRPENPVLSLRLHPGHK